MCFELPQIFVTKTQSKLLKRGSPLSFVRDFLCVLRTKQRKSVIKDYGEPLKKKGEAFSIMFYIFPLCLGHESLWPQGIKPPDKTQRKSLIKIIENPKGILNIKIQLDPFNFRGVGGVLHYRGCPYSILVYALCGYRVFPLKTESARKRNFCSIF